MNSEIKVLFPVGSLFPDESGGVSISLYWLLKGLNSLSNFKLKTITTTFGIKQGTVEENTWLNTDYGQVIYLHTRHHKFEISIIRTFLKEVKDTHIVHLSSIFYPPSLICFFIAYFYKKKIIWSTHGSIDDIEFLKKGYLKKTVIKLLRHFTSKVVFHATSDEEVNYIYKYFGLSSETIKITNYMVLPQPVMVKKEPYFLYIGRFHSKKGIDNLLKSLIKSKFFMNSPFILKIAGEYNNEFGNYILQLHKKLNLGDKVEFLGHIGSTEKVKLLSSAYFMFLPSFSENFGIVVAESLSYGTPVVASIYTPWKTLADYGAGFWVDNDIDTLANTVDIIISLKNESYINYANNSIKLINTEFDIFLNIKTWEKAYNEILNAN